MFGNNELEKEFKREQDQRSQTMNEVRLQEGRQKTR